MPEFDIGTMDARDGAIFQVQELAVAPVFNLAGPSAGPGRLNDWRGVLQIWLLQCCEVEQSRRGECELFESDVKRGTCEKF